MLQLERKLGYEVLDLNPPRFLTDDNKALLETREKFLVTTFPLPLVPKRMSFPQPESFCLPGVKLLPECLNDFTLSPVHKATEAGIRKWNLQQHRMGWDAFNIKSSFSNLNEFPHAFETDCRFGSRWAIAPQATRNAAHRVDWRGGHHNHSGNYSQVTEELMGQESQQHNNVSWRFCGTNSSDCKLWSTVRLPKGRYSHALHFTDYLVNLITLARLRRGGVKHGRR